MIKNRLLLLFILSFLGVIYTLNSLCYKYIDNRVDTFFVNNKFNLSKIELVNSEINEKNIKVLSEQQRLVVTLVFSLLFIAVFVYSGSFFSAIFLILFLIAYFLAYSLSLNHFICINLVGVFLSVPIAQMYAYAYLRIFKENRNKNIENVLSKYISKDIKNKILKSKTDIGLGGKRAEITVMFADIRGFTSLSETMKAEDVSQLLNEYFTELEPVITKYNGVINKFIGDALLVIFGDPEQDKFHAKNAVKCAYELCKKVKEIKDRWMIEGKPKIDIGVGINTGEAFIGNVGTKNRFEYTVIGDTVNIASRIEDYNKIYKTHVLISENTYSKISDIVDVIKIREVSIKGKRHKINIYEVLRIIEND